MATQVRVVREVSGPDLLLTACLLTIAYAGDLALTMMGHRFVSTFREMNPIVDVGHWQMAALFKLCGLALLWLGVRTLWRTRWHGHYAWLLGGFAVFYLMLDTYQVVMLQ